MRIRISRIFQIISVALLLSLSSCDQINRWTNSALDLVGIGSKSETKKQKSVTQKKTAKKSKTNKKPTENKRPKEPTPKKEDNKDKALIVTRDTQDAKKVVNTKVKKTKAPKFTVDAPVHVQKRIGGVARHISSDDTYIYIDFPQNFSVYDLNFNLLAQTTINSPLVKVTRFVKDGQTYLYLKEENHVFEIFQLKEDKKNPQIGHSLIEQDSIQMDGDYSWIDADTIVVYMPTQIEFRDISDLEKFKIISENDIPDVTSSFAIKNYLYLSRDQFLDVIDLNDFSLISSIRIGKVFSFLGIVDHQGQKNLLLSFVNKNNHIFGVQFLRLNKDFSGITSFGENHLFPVDLKNYSVSLSQKLIIGQEIENNLIGPVHVYSIEHDRFLRGVLGTFTKLVAWSFNKDQLYLVNNQEISVNQLQLDERVISQSKSIQKILDSKSNTPLAQIGAPKIVKDEYQIVQIKKMDFMSDARKVALLDKNHFIIFENFELQNQHRIFATKDFAKDDYILSEPFVSKSTKYDQMLSTDFGLFTFSNRTNEIYFLDTQFKKLEILNIPVNNLYSWVHFSTDNGEVLAISSNKTSSNKNRKGKEPFETNFYILKSPTDIQLANSIPSDQKPFVFYIPDDQIVILTNVQMSLYDWNKIASKESTPDQDKDSPTSKKDRSNKNSKNQDTSTVEPEEKIDLSNLNLKIEAAKISPAFDTLYLLTKSDTGYNIYVMDIFDIAKNAVLKDFDIDSDQFKGSSFSKEGRLFILPSHDGTLFYDMTDIKNPREVANWAEPSYYADLADQGQFICVALGYKGVYCGQLLF